jgi:hypothetical protein
MVDAAIERIARERSAYERGQRGAIERVREAEHEGGHELDLAPYESRAPIQRLAKPTRLRWKGLDVSEEFRSYAERVARGEDLPPFEGRVLAEPNPAFPWDPGAPRAGEQHEERGSGKALWFSAAVVLALLAWTIAARFEGSAAIASDDPAAFDEATASRATLPHDVVESDVVESDVVESAALGERAADGARASASGGTSESVSAGAPPTTPPEGSRVEPAGSQGQAAAAVKPAPAPVVAPPAAAPAPAPAALASTAPASNVAADSAKLAPPVAPAPTSALVARAPDPVAASPATTTRDEDFGILPEGDPPPAAAGTGPTPTPSAAKSVPIVAGNIVAGNVGDLARAGDPLPPGVRKEPERESSAKGSLLVETPPF